MNQTELINYLARWISNLHTDLDLLRHEVNKHIDHSDHGVRLSWNLAHLGVSCADLSRDLERLQQELNKENNAGTKIQNKLRRDDIQD